MATTLPYNKLRVRLRRAPKLLEGDEVWGKRLLRREWTIFQREEFRDGWWLGLPWKVIKRDGLLRIEGKRGGRWEPVSTWLVEQTRRRANRARDASVSDGSVRKAKSLEEIREALAGATGRKSRRGELVFHLSEHVGMTREETRQIMKRILWDVPSERLAGLRRNGRDRLDRGEKCCFCIRVTK